MSKHILYRKDTPHSPALPPLAKSRREGRELEAPPSSQERAYGGRGLGWGVATIFITISLFLWLIPSLSAQDAPIYALPDPDDFTPRISQPFAVLRSGWVAVVNPDYGTVGMVDLEARALVSEIAVGGNPIAIALTSDNASLYVACADDNTIYVIDTETLTVSNIVPLEKLEVTGGQVLKGMVILNDTTVVIAMSDALIRYDLTTGARLRIQVALANTLATFAVWGDLAFVRPFGSEVMLLTQPNNAVEIVLTPNTNIAVIGRMAIDEDEGLLYMAYTRREDTETFDTRYQPEVAVIDLARFTVVDTLSLDVVDSAWHLPSAVALSNDGSLLYVAYAASNRFSVIDLETRQRVATAATANNPIAIGFSRDNAEMFTINSVGSTLSLFDTQFHFPIDTIATTNETRLADVGRGEDLFYTANDPQIAWNNSTSCNTCHSGRVTETMPAATLPDDLNAPQARQFLREHIVNTQGGTGLSDVDLDALIAYLRATSP